MAKGTLPGTTRPGLWTRLWQRPQKWWLLGIPIGGFVMLLVGAAGLGTVNWVVHRTSSTEFCFGCHSHDQFIRPEYEASTHFRNQVGVRAGCADCHLPHDNWFELMLKKVIVVKDVFGEMSGKISTADKYEAHRSPMALKVWEQMLNNDSKFCHSCHSFEAMNTTEQGKMPARMHTRAVQSGQSCIECHRGIVHALPQNADELWEQALKETGKATPAT
jgi:nitrate/TMAO reductase-like tetraheme cytochrome c subunit